MANKPHTDIERRALFTTALRLARKGFDRIAISTKLYADWRPPFDFSTVCWAAEDAEAVAAIEQIRPAHPVGVLAGLRREAMMGSKPAARTLQMMARDFRAQEVTDE